MTLMKRIPLCYLPFLLTYQRSTYEGNGPGEFAARCSEVIHTLQMQEEKKEYEIVTDIDGKLGRR